MEHAVSPEVSVRLGEVVEATTSGFITQCYRLYEAPPLGSLVRCGRERPVFGIVFEVATRSMDPARHPIPRGEEEETEEAVYLSNPQLTRLLHTEFRSLAVGHRSNGKLLRYVAPDPPRIHSFVYRCVADEMLAFSSSLEFLSTLLAASMPSADDLQRLSGILKRLSP